MRYVENATRPQVIAHRKSADGVGVDMYDDGAVTGRMGIGLRGVPIVRPKTDDARQEALRAGWLFLGEVELYDSDELGALYDAAKKVARRGGNAGDVRALVAQPKTATPTWKVTETDRDGRPRERWWILPRIQWPGLAVLNIVNAQKPYVLMRKIHGDTYEPTGFEFANLRALTAHLESEKQLVGYRNNPTICTPCGEVEAGWAPELTPNRSMSLDEGERHFKDIRAAADIRRKFQDAEPAKLTIVSWRWPTHMREVGRAEAEMYVSNKWKKNPRWTEDYKHIAEGPQRLYFTEEFERGFGFYDDGEACELVGPTVEVDGPMPDSFAVLAPMLGLQCTFYKGTDRKPILPRDNSYQINIPNAHVGGAEHPDTGDKFLIIYSPKGLHCIITGDILGIEKDGIVG